MSATVAIPSQNKIACPMDRTGGFCLPSQTGMDHRPRAFFANFRALLFFFVVYFFARD